MINFRNSILIILVFIFAGSAQGFCQQQRKTIHRRSINWDYYRKGKPLDSIAIGNTAGCIAPTISLRDFDNQERSTEELKGKLVLIHFWSSHCMHCRKYNKELVKNYIDYKDSVFYNGDGFEVYSVSLDTKNEEWKLAVKQDSLIWPNHVNDHKGWMTELKKEFNFNKTPTTFLIDKDGVIIAKNVIGSSLDRRLKFFLKGTEEEE